MKKILLAGVFALAGSAAFADTFTYDGASINPANVSVTISSPVARTVLAGEITLNGAGPNTGTNLAVWCLDLFNSLVTNSLYTYQENMLTTAGAGGSNPALTTLQITEIGDLMLSGDADLAAVQLAIWKVEYGANFTVLGAPPSETTEENKLLAEVQPGGALYNTGVNVTLLHDAIVSPNQSLAFAAPVPGPTLGGGLPGILAGFAGLGMVGLQRSRKRRSNPIGA